MSARFAACAMALLACAAAPALGASQQGGTRLWLEAGPSFDRSEHVESSRTGYALAGGAEFGRLLGLTLAVGFEHYPGEMEPYTLEMYPGSQPPSLRVEGGGNKTALTGSVGVRLGIPFGSVEPFVEGGFGLTSISRRTPRFVNPDSGTVVYEGGNAGTSEALGEFGLGVRTHRASGYDWTFALRWRGHSELFEGESGRSMQVRLGIVTP